MNYFEYLGIKIYLGDFTPVKWVLWPGNEFWKEVPDYEGLYFASTKGRIKSAKRNGSTGGIVSPQTVKGYYSLKLCKNNVPIRYPVHKIIASTFLQKPDFYECINHKNAIKTVNTPYNLEYTTTLLNNRHAWAMGLNERTRENMRKLAKTQIGALNPVSRPVEQICKITGAILNTFISATEAANLTGCCRQHISHCCVGTRKETGGFKWRHKIIENENL